MYTLYKLTCTISGKVYIGITKHSVKKRWKQHVSTAFSQKKKHYKRAGENNPMFGKARPDYVKKAVSERRRQEADTTLRDWYHTSGLVEKQIRTLDLRDKYGLNISHLKKITDNHPKYKQHKGWRLYVETSDTRRIPSS